MPNLIMNFNELSGEEKVKNFDEGLSVMKDDNLKIAYDFIYERLSKYNIEYEDGSKIIINPLK
jgi:predicted methyltransferase